MQCNTPVASEVLNVVLAANIAPDRQDDTQLLQAINTLIANGGSGGSGGNGGGSGAEIGSVTAFAMPTPPEGWLVCDGSAVSRTDYADLFAAIGTVWGDGDEITTFNLPDLRGEFIRGFDAGREADAGREFASWQADEFKRHTHTYTRRSGTAEAGSSGPGSRTNLETLNTSETGGDETRPRNIAMTYAIKAFYPVAASA
ncbi:tail fiber protein [Thalassospira xiamenensis]|uniref:Microcystin-dependent protein n=1 Tax=Thalassospira xiamenensis TaxID=220697 RepID=A0A285RLS8_9PROT|nr:tail fiber protein [Thalassospira xiamenensis]SOB95075.1 Microcystin-dependent protein [Thalassospira xiamenensis]